MLEKIESDCLTDVNKSNSLDLIHMFHIFRTRSAYQDIVFVAVVSVLFLSWAVFFDLYEKLYVWSRQYDIFEIDEFLLLAFVLFPGLVWFAVRRWQEAVDSYKQVMEAQQVLKKHQQEQENLLAQNRSLLNKITQAQEDERKRIAMDLHDIFGQHLTAIHAIASTIKLKTGDAPHLKDLSNKIISSSEQLSRVARLMFNELRPPVLENIGLSAAIKNYLSEWNENYNHIEAQYDHEGDDQSIDENINLILYRSMQEALTNIVKHSQARNIHISTSVSGFINNDKHMTIKMHIQDDGIGFDSNNSDTGLGLIGIRERVLNAGGLVSINSKPESGTLISITINQS